MRRQAAILGTSVVVCYGLLAAWVVLDTAGRDDGDGRPRVGEVAAERLVAVWERSRTATFVATGVTERRSEVTGMSISSEHVLAQRPPQRLQRAHGGVDGRHDDRPVVCPATTTGGTGRCRLGPPGPVGYDEAVAREVEALRSLVIGPDRLYDVVLAGDGCFELSQRRVDPRAPYGVAARLCFDPATGAPTEQEVRHPGGVVERLAVHDVRTEVTDADLTP